MSNRAQPHVLEAEHEYENNDSYVLYGLTEFGYLPVGIEQAKRFGFDTYFGELCDEQHRARYVVDTCCVQCIADDAASPEAAVPIPKVPITRAKHSEDSRAKRSALMRETWALRRKNGTSALSEETKQKMSQKRFEYWERKRREKQD